ncbi:metalloprotease-like protein [Beauveria bassiana ARSEF 2860]|uniref:Metalloprotease-like protein n=1 Tax=Beauveria bassiana (strain ARSEF 2860) TaxID=655819 RepID=J5JC35_BEAB2|nr:metalloprotease-like protein [Beauveria bassiana ARSEF 2860]EJP61471.1 metalloprotease-like protein [Beauveria bassiana ARSEF 2860]
MAEKEIEDLKKQLKEARAREENERREKEEAKAREENERRKNQRTTLAEYLYNCHFDLYQKLRLAGPSESSTGLATSVDGKYYPRWLRPWRAFTDSQRQEHFDDIIRICGERRVFQQESTTRDNGINFERKKADLTFINGIRNFKDLNEDIGAETKTGRGKQQPDGGGIRTGIDENESPAFMYDYKAAHKFAVEDLEAALERETLFMDVYEWAQTDQYKTDSTLRTKEREAARITMALIQVFNYMLWYGVGYGYVAAGKSLVLLYYDRAEPLVLRWHLCVPDKMVIRPTAELHVEQVSQTAVAQLASFCLLSLRSQALTGRPLKDAMDQAEGILKKWKREAYTDPVTPQESDDTDSSSSMPSRGTDKTFACDESPVARKYPLRSKSSCKDSTAPLESRDEDEEGGAEGYQRQRGAGASVNKGEKDSSRKSKDKGTGGSAPAPTKQYCTQACLLGLKLGRKLDSRCPNVLYHGVGGNTRHPIDAQELTKLMSEQLRQDPYGSCDALIGRRKYGSSGVLFKLELARFGYTFVGKGTVSARPTRLEHECSIYQRLEKLQGDVVPVHLGMVSFRPGYLLPGGAYVIHIMLMSWAGVAMDTTLSNLEWEVQRSIQTIYENGVNHQDEREPNLLWNAERCRVMVIDFDQATVLPPPKHKRLLGHVHAGEGPHAIRKAINLLFPDRPETPHAGQLVGHYSDEGWGDVVFTVSHDLDTNKTVLVGPREEATFRHTFVLEHITGDYWLVKAAMLGNSRYTDKFFSAKFVAGWDF